MRRVLLSLLLAPLLAAPVIAHPVPKTNRDRTIVVRVTPGALVVDYRLELDEASIPDELTLAEKARVTTRAELLETFTRSFADATCRTLDASLDGQDLQFKCVQQKYTATDHVRCDYRFEATLTPAADEDHKVKFHDTNFNTDQISRIHLYLAADDKVRLVAAKAPTAEMMNRPSDERKPGESDQLRRAAATFRLAVLEPRGLFKPSFPPDDVVLKSEPDGPVTFVKPSATPAETASKEAPPPTMEGRPQPEPKVEPLPAPSDLPDPSGTSTVTAAPSFWLKINDPNALMNLMLDSREGMVLLLLVATLIGAAHALTPGHGKTLVAAYLVGQRGTYWHAVILGIVTTLTHTAVVIVAAVLIRLIPGIEQPLFALQGLLGGFLITGLGLWLLIRRLSGQADHFHLGGGHHHHHGHGHSHDHHHEHVHSHVAGAEDHSALRVRGAAVPTHAGSGHTHSHTHLPGMEDHVHDEHGSVLVKDAPRSKLWEVITLGMAGGMIPCIEAIALLGWTISKGQAHLGLPIVLAFSFGLAAVLVILGLSVVGAKRVAQLTAPSSRRLQALARPLPILSAIIVTLLGLWLCYGAFNP